MKLLLDTHFLIWLARYPQKISDGERSLLTHPDNEPTCSILSIWEIRIKWNTLDRAGGRKGAISVADAIEFARANRLELEPLTIEDLVGDLVPKLPHRDPFDEMLLMQANRLGARLLTRDGKLRDHPLALVP